MIPLIKNSHDIICIHLIFHRPFVYSGQKLFAGASNIQKGIFVQRKAVKKNTCTLFYTILFIFYCSENIYDFVFRKYFFSSSFIILFVKNPELIRQIYVF